jgi:hypothetical protein
MREAGDVERAKADVESADAQLRELESELQRDIDALSGDYAELVADTQHATVRPRKTSIAVRAVVLAWVPHRSSGGGEDSAAWR